jgi:hypothetical protein
MPSRPPSKGRVPQRKQALDYEGRSSFGRVD